jgi:Raf kinase inhibitor-like YbhB/YbcL family protein
LRINDVPPQARSLALIMDDPDAPNGTFTHWLIFNIAPKTTAIEENIVPSGAVQGINDYGKSNYGGPKPPSGTHRYFFKLNALDTTLEFPEGIHRAQLEPAIKKHSIESAVLMGTYTHSGD